MKIIEITSLTELVPLLNQCGLPSTDLGTCKNSHYFAGFEQGVATGCIGVELYGSIALLRSLAVDPAYRNKGVGSLLVNHAEHFCKSMGIHAIYLLTTTADAYFLAKGYTALPRDSAPVAIKGSAEYSGICPASSVLMTKALAGLLTF